MSKTSPPKAHTSMNSAILRFGLAEQLTTTSVPYRSPSKRHVKGTLLTAFPNVPGLGLEEETRLPGCK